MCGIVGYIGKLAAAPVILEGLSKLEYRGYDSAGMAVSACACHDTTYSTPATRGSCMFSTRLMPCGVCVANMTDRIGLCMGSCYGMLKSGSGSSNFSERMANAVSDIGKGL